MKKISVLRIIEIVLAAVTAVFLLVFFILTSNYSKTQKAAEAELLAAVDNVNTLCTSYSQYIDISENLKGDLDIYAENIANADSTQKKAYYANIMLTYTQNRVNMNDPQNLYELAQELGDSYDIDPLAAAAYKSYVEKLTAASNEFKAAESKYNSISNEQ